MIQIKTLANGGICSFWFALRTWNSECTLLDGGLPPRHKRQGMSVVVGNFSLTLSELL